MKNSRQSNDKITFRISEAYLKTTVSLGLLLASCSPGILLEPQTSSDRIETMVSRQLAARGIDNERVLAAFRKVPRHLFVPEILRHDAYADYPLPIGEGQTISQPYIVALMTQIARPEPKDRALEVGTGSGYQAAILAELVSEVYTIEIVAALGERARETLREQGYSNVTVRIGDGYRGWPGQAPFDIVMVTAAAEEIPPLLIEQLADGGRLVMPVGRINDVQVLTLLEKDGEEIKKTRITGVRFVPLTGEVLKPPQ